MSINDKDSSEISKRPTLKRFSSSRGSIVILRNLGMENTLALRLREQSIAGRLGASSFRAPSDINPWETQAQRVGGAQKSGMTLTKSSNWGPMRGLISADSKFTKIETDADTKKRKAIGLSKIDEEKTPLYIMDGDLKKVAATESLRSILNRVGPDRDYKIAGFDLKTRRLSFVCNDGKKPDDMNVEFSVVLKKEEVKDENDQPNYEIRFDRSKQLASSRNFEQMLYGYRYNAPNELKNLEMEDPSFKIMDYLDVELDCYQQEFKFDEKGNKEYLNSPGIIEVFADAHGNPYTGDWDQLLTAHSCKLPDWMRHPINTFDYDHKEENKYKLKQWSVDAYEWLDKNGYIDHSIKSKMYSDSLSRGEEVDFVDLMSDFLLTRAGSITPFEFVKNCLQNYLNNGLAPDSLRSLQHGCENRNPYEPSDLDGNMLHFIDGEIVKTSNEQEIVDLYLNRVGFLANNNIDLHPKWNMEKWGGIVGRQLKIAEDKIAKGEVDSVYLPPAAVIENYNKYLIENNKLPILDRVSNILLEPEFFKNNNFYDVSPRFFTGLNAEEKFYATVGNQLKYVTERKEAHEPYHTLNKECLEAYAAIKEKMAKQQDDTKIEDLSFLERMQTVRANYQDLETVKTHLPQNNFTSQSSLTFGFKARADEGPKEPTEKEKSRPKNS